MILFNFLLGVPENDERIIFDNLDDLREDLYCLFMTDGYDLNRLKSLFINYAFVDELYYYKEEDDKEDDKEPPTELEVRYFKDELNTYISDNRIEIEFTEDMESKLDKYNNIWNDWLVLVFELDDMFFDVLSKIDTDEESDKNEGN